MKRFKAIVVNPCKWIESDKPWHKGVPWFAPFSILVVAAFVRKVSKLIGLQYDVRVWDENILGPIKESDLQGFDLCLLSYLTPSRLGAFRVAGLAKKLHIPTMAGGIDVSGWHRVGGEAEMLRHFDSIYVGCLTTDKFTEALSDFESDYLKPLYFVDTTVTHVPYEFIMPALDLINPGDYFFFCVQSSTGCPHNCIFCGVGLITGYGQVHCMPEEILREILEYLVSLKIHFFMDFSDCFGGNKKYYTSVVLPMYQEYMEKAGIHWGTEISVPILGGTKDGEGLIYQMDRAGCLGVYLGIESLWKKLGKNDPANVRRVIKLLRKMKKTVVVAEIPDLDEKATLRRSLSDLWRLSWWGARLYQFALLTPIPGTPLMIEQEAAGKILSYDPRLYDGSQPNIFHRVSCKKRLFWLRTLYFLSLLNVPMLLFELRKEKSPIYSKVVQAIKLISGSLIKWQLKGGFRLRH